MDLLKNIIKSIKGRTKETLDLLERMTESDLEIYLRDLLKERKYLLVVDDVWQREACESLRRAFPDSKNGSRVIITTRKEDVAKRADDNGFVHKLRFLSQEESWDLFRRKLLDVLAMVPTMEILARDMVDKCGGLPLAIVVLKDHLIYVDNIMWLWIAEGFIPRGEERIEDVAEGFLDELARRSLIQVVSTSWKTDVRCKIHDLLRDLAMQKALEVNFFDIYDPRKHSLSSSCLRHAVHGQAQRYLSLDLSILKLRSFMFLDQDFCNMGLLKYYNVFRHIYVLYLEIRSGTTLPDAVGCLYHLKFLSLRGIYYLPSSIGNLKNLQTLRVLNDYRHLCVLPPETTNLVNLRHIVALYSRPLQLLSKLTSLQVLKYSCCDQWRDVDPVNLVRLQELGMYDSMHSYSLNNIGSLKDLRSLMLRCKLNESFPTLEYLTSCRKLDKLWLEGRIDKLPLRGGFPNSITMMVLWKSELMEDPMPILGMLPNLRDLDLVGAYEGKEITCGNNSFCQLEFLRLDGLQKLERWHLSSSSMPLIIGFGIHDCSKLKEIPQRMKGITILDRLKDIDQEFGEYYKVNSLAS
ncbi:putative disease resistance protein RPP13-like [Capsicum annuum]|nr:putative disease resistance protein RPP13-like [Capsicum annuum]KAF3683594.1 putative disease resistance protein RPP13-like [Capsicum annuum]